MKALVYYVDFHWDNYQGGSGKNYEFRCAVNLRQSLQVQEIEQYIIDFISEVAARQRPFKQDNSPSVIRIELV